VRTDSTPCGFPIETKRAGHLKLNDPFGRVSSRNEASYQSLRDRLQQEGIRDDEAVRRVTTRMTATVVKGLGVLIGVSVALIILFPPLRITLLGIDILIVLWVSVVYLKTRMHLNRYLLEECGKS